MCLGGDFWRLLLSLNGMVTQGAADLPRFSDNQIAASLRPPNTTLRSLIILRDLRGI